MILVNYLFLYTSELNDSRGLHHKTLKTKSKGFNHNVFSNFISRFHHIVDFTPKEKVLMIGMYNSCSEDNIFQDNICTYSTARAVNVNLQLCIIF